MATRTQAQIEVWGTIVYLEIWSNTVDELRLKEGIAEVEHFYREVDEVFSTYKENSVISRLRRIEISIEDCPPDVIEVWNLCAYARELTEGSFDPWCVEGGFDPSGYVKGWAADRGIGILQAHGAEHIQINAAGDLALAGGLVDGKPWSIGIRHPEEAHTVVKVFEITDGAIATSGTYERGAHIRDPHTGMIAIGARSASVVGPDGGLADALATALVVSGKDGAAWFLKPELLEYQCWVIERHSDSAWGFDPRSIG
ncbi:MAG: FAD:protein FMN transferase [Actinomycetes bacterium]